LKIIRTKTLATTIIATTATTIKMISGFESSFFEAGLAKDAADTCVNVAAWVPHLWQNRAFSSSLAPHLRQ